MFDCGVIWYIHILHPFPTLNSVLKYHHYRFSLHGLNLILWLRLVRRLGLPLSISCEDLGLIASGSLDSSPG